MRRAILCCIPFLLCACAGLVPSEPTVMPIPAAQSPLAILSGALEYTGNRINNRGDNAVMLLDLHGFVKRDHDFEPSSTSQVLGPLELNTGSTTGRFTLHLPAVPGGSFSDLDENGRRDRGVQIFNLIWWSNEASGPFADHDDQLRGWGQSYTSTIHDTNSDGEIIGGTLLVWAPDSEQRFPVDLGPDGLLFTADDPLGTIAPGYTIVDLDKHPFVHRRNSEEEVILYERSDYATQDYQSKSYTAAFTALAQRVRDTYAFAGLPDREPDWDTLIPKVTEQVQQAENRHDVQAFYLALREFTYAFQDGHVAVDSTDLRDNDFNAQYGGGYGFGAHELDDGRFLVTFVQDHGPAQIAEMEVGAEFLRFNQQPVDEALQTVIPYSAPYSTKAEMRYQQLRYLLRASVGTTATVEFKNPAGEAQTVSLVAIDEHESLDETSIYAGLDSWALPVEYWYLDDRIGNILVGTNADDAALTLELFERALDAFESDQVNRIVIDFRQDDGGALLGLAGFFSDKEIPLAQEFQRDTATGVFEARGAPIIVRPKGRTFEFKKIAVLVGFGCASACESEVYALSKLPNVEIVGQYPTSGMFASVITDEYKLPERITLQFSKWRYQTPDGLLFLEGIGVQPTVRVPVDIETVLSDEDVVRQAAVRALGTE